MVLNHPLIFLPLPLTFLRIWNHTYIFLKNFWPFIRCGTCISSFICNFLQFYIISGTHSTIEMQCKLCVCVCVYVRVCVCNWKDTFAFSTYITEQPMFRRTHVPAGLTDTLLLTYEPRQRNQSLGGGCYKQQRCIPACAVWSAPLLFAFKKISYVNLLKV